MCVFRLLCFTPWFTFWFTPGFCLISPNSDAFVCLCVGVLAFCQNIFRMLASSGLILNSLGNYDHCVHANQMRYCVLDGTAHELAQGLCFPHSCSPDDLEAFFAELFSNSPDEVRGWLDEHLQPIWDEVCQRSEDPRTCEAEYEEIRDQIVFGYEVMYRAQPKMVATCCSRAATSTASCSLA